MRTRSVTVDDLFGELDRIAGAMEAGVAPQIDDATRTAIDRSLRCSEVGTDETVGDWAKRLAKDIAALG